MTSAISQIKLVWRLSGDIPCLRSTNTCMLEKGHGTVALYLACTGLTWYFVLWAISLLGCLAV